MLPGTLAGLRPGERARVSTSLVVREDALTLYGFGSDDERNTFELLQTASGIGPRLALGMLATFTPDALRRAVAAEDVTALTSVPGIGRKGAQRIVLELAGRLGSPGDGGPAATGMSAAVRAAGAGTLTWRDQVRTGLVNLGWQARDADQAIAVIEPELMAGLAAGAGGGAAANGGQAGGPAGGGTAGGGDPAAAQDAAGTAGAATADVDVAVALRAALRVLGRK